MESAKKFGQTPPPSFGQNPSFFQENVPKTTLVWKVDSFNSPQFWFKKDPKKCQTPWRPKTTDLIDSSSSDQELSSSGHKVTQKGPMWIHFIFVLDLSRAISLRPAHQELFFWETFILIFMFQLSLAIKIWYWKHEVKTTIITAAEGTHPSSVWWEQCIYMTYCRIKVTFQSQCMSKYLRHHRLQ